MWGSPGSHRKLGGLEQAPQGTGGHIYATRKEIRTIFALEKYF